MSFAAAQYKATRVETGSPVQLVVQLLDGAVAAMRRASACPTGRDTGGRAADLHRAHAIVSELWATLDESQAPELCAQLTALYDFVLERVGRAYHDRDPVTLEPAIRTLTQLRGAWAELARQGQ